MPIKICKHCGKEFEPASRNERYCSGKCVVAKEHAYNRRHVATFSVERKRAAVLIGCAIASGKIIRQSCEVCGPTTSFEVIQAHHDDYAKPLEVRWLCRSHHKQHHHKFGPGKNAFLPVAEIA